MMTKNWIIRFFCKHDFDYSPSILRKYCNKCGILNKNYVKF